jgi:hypothetical protein
VETENRLIIISSGSKKYLSVITKGQEFITNEGKIEFDKIEKIPSNIQSSTGKEFLVYAPSYREFILLMKRGPQIIYPKDLGSIIISANINSNSNVLEIGTGSGALTLFLALLLGTLYSTLLLQMYQNLGYFLKIILLKMISIGSHTYLQYLKFLRFLKYLMKITLEILKLRKF